MLFCLNVSVKQGVEEDASGPPTCRVKLVKPVSEPGAASTQSQPERMTAAKLFTPSEVYTTYIHTGTN